MADWEVGRTAVPEGIAVPPRVGGAIELRALDSVGVGQSGAEISGEPMRILIAMIRLPYGGKEGKEAEKVLNHFPKLA